MRIQKVEDPVYAPNSMGGPAADSGRYPYVEKWEADGEFVHAAYTLHRDDDDWGQAGTLIREVMDNAQRNRLVSNVVGHLSQGVSPARLGTRPRVLAQHRQRGGRPHRRRSRAPLILASGLLRTPPAPWPAGGSCGRRASRVSKVDEFLVRFEAGCYGRRSGDPMEASSLDHDDSRGRTGDLGPGPQMSGWFSHLGLSSAQRTDVDRPVSGSGEADPHGRQGRGDRVRNGR
jgi:hypothetical protein